MRKKIFILLVLLLLTGCKAKYNLQINFGGNFIETGTISFNSNLLGKGGYSSSTNEFLHQMGDKYNFNWIVKKLPFDNGSYVGYDFYQRYPNYDRYASQSPAIKALFNGLSVDSNDHYVKLNSRGYNSIPDYNKPNGDFPTRVEGIEINISLPYKVVKHNASRVDNDTNTYTWTFNANTPNTKGINLEYRDNEIYTYNPAYLIKFVSPYIYITLLLVIVVLIAISSIKTKARFRNRI